MAGDGGGGGGPPRWQDVVDPALRPRVFNKMLTKLSQVYERVLAPSQELHKVAATFEQRVFNEADSKEEYMRRISQKLISLEQKRQPILQAASAIQQQIQMGSQVRQVKAVHTNQGGNSSSTAMSQVVSTMPSGGRQSSQMQNLPMTPPISYPVPNQDVAHHFAPNMQTKVKKEQTEVMPVLDQTHNTLPASDDLSGPDVPSGQNMIEAVTTQNQNQLPAMLLQPKKFSGCNPASVEQRQGQQVVQSNVQQNRLLRQNDRGTGTLPQPPMMIMMNQQGLGVNQQQMDRKRYHSDVPQQGNVAKMHIGHPGVQNNQQNVGRTIGLQSPLTVYEQEVLKEQIKIEPQPMIPHPQMITVGQQSNMLSTMGNAGEVDWREEMFQEIKPLKDAYLLELVEFDRSVFVPYITKKQLESLPKDKADQYRIRAHLKKKIRTMLNFLQFQKSNIPENWRGQLPMLLKSIQDLITLHRKSKARKAEIVAKRDAQISCGQPRISSITSDVVPSSGATSRQQKQNEKPADSNFSQAQCNIVASSPACQKSHCNISPGATISSATKEPGLLQSLPTNQLVNYTPSPITESGDMKDDFPSNSVKSTLPSPVVKTCAIKVALPSSLMKSTLPSPVAKPGAAKVASPSASVESTLLSPAAKPGAAKVASPSALVETTLPSPNAKPCGTKVASPSTSLESTLPSPIAKPCAEKVAFPSASVKSTLPSPATKPGVSKVPSPSSSVSTVPSPVVNSGVIQPASPCVVVKSTLPSSVVNSGVVPAASPYASLKSTSLENVENASACLLHDNEAATKCSKQITPTKPTIPASLQAQTTDLQAYDQEFDKTETPMAKKPIEHLIDIVRSSTPAALRSSASSFSSVMMMNDWVPHGEIGAFQDWAFLSQQGGSCGLNKVKRTFENTTSCFETTPLHNMDGSCISFDCDASEVESSFERSAKRLKTQNTKDDLVDEIKATNSMLIDTIISICGDYETDGTSSCNGGTLIKLSYTAISLRHDLISLTKTSGMSLVRPAKLLVPADYPRSSPILVNNQGEEQLRMMFSDISGSVDVAFRRALDGLPEPRSIREVARAWDSSVRRAIMEFAHRYGGGTFSSRYGRWESY
ncbi:hypothetical protein ACP70R_012025 [Stipagrostis hirtigluma subsp. patula]